MSYIDLHTALSEWPFEPEQISVRKILGMDGVVRLQMRVELGILQMEAEGRPDGMRPFGCSSLLEYHREQATEYERRNGTLLGYDLSVDECQELRAETSLYYRRYVAEFVLEEYESVHRDTAHNIAVFDICRDHALEEDDRKCLEQFRPYVFMMDARARAYDALEKGEPASALAHVNRGLMHIRSHFAESGEPEVIDQCEEARVLQTLAAELTPKIPEDSLIVTRKALREAIDSERFEEAAKLRDTLKERYGLTS